MVLPDVFFNIAGTSVDTVAITLSKKALCGGLRHGC